MKRYSYLALCALSAVALQATAQDIPDAIDDEADITADITSEEPAEPMYGPNLPVFGPNLPTFGPITREEAEEAEARHIKSRLKRGLGKAFMKKALHRLVAHKIMSLEENAKREKRKNKAFRLMGLKKLSALVNNIHMLDARVSDLEEKISNLES
jgi:hypothetical protein